MSICQSAAISKIVKVLSSTLPLYCVVYYRQPTASNPSLVRRVTLSGGMLPVPLYSHSADTNAGRDVRVSAENDSVTVTQPASLIPTESNGTDTLPTSGSKDTDTLHTLDCNINITQSASKPNGNVSLTMSQPKVDVTPSTSQTNGAVTLAKSSISTAVSRQQQ